MGAINIPRSEAIKARWQSHDGSIVLLQGDCLALLDILPRVDCILTDPPYGIGRDRGMGGGGTSTLLGKKRWSNRYSGKWDSKRPDDAIFDWIATQSKALAVVWGGNYFADVLPQSSKWLVWDKINTMPSYSDAELAWTNAPGNATKMLRHNGNGLMAVEKGREHPTQKPVALMMWCMDVVAFPTGALVLDLFAGSGTTGVACIKTGRSFIGIEIDPTYYEIAVKRCDAESRQIKLF